MFHNPGFFRFCLFLPILYLSLIPFSLSVAEISFNRDVLPILSDNCFKCHGPDQRTRQANLRLDLKESALRAENPVIQPRDVGNSQLIVRIVAGDPMRVMPPPSSKLELTSEQITTLKQWVTEGARWDDHWAFIPPSNPTLPPTLVPFAAENEIDLFVHRRLKEAQLEPSTRADKETLIRRVTIDLTGLPPTIEAIESFLSDKNSDAYEQLVNSLLTTEAHAERLTLDWMDLARYADSHGLHADGWRRMWPWRDWVISAFQKNTPYDQFVTWQLAGDLMPNPGKEQILATAFHRNHPMTAEGGVIDEEFRLYYVFDRLETTATAFLGLTMNCARCHDHKFDPISQKEYYQLAAFFNNVRELGMTGDDGNYGPVLALPDDNTEKKLAEIDRQLETAQKKLDQIQQQAKAEFTQLVIPPNTIVEPLDTLKVHRFPLDEIVTVEIDEGKIVQTVDGNHQSTVSVPPQPIDGVDGKALWIEGEYQHLSLKDIGNGDVTDPFTISLWIKPQSPTLNGGEQVRHLTNRTLLGTSGGKNQYWRGWELYLDLKGHLATRLIHNLPDNLIHVRSLEQITDDEWTHITFSYDGTGQATGVSLFLNGQSVPTEIVMNQLTRTILPKDGKARDVRVARSYRGFTGDFGIYQGGMDDIRFYNSALTRMEIDQLYQSYHQLDTKSKINKTTTVTSTSSDQFQHWLHRSRSDWQAALNEYRVFKKQRVELFSQVPLVMVMKEMEKARETYRLYRGEYGQPRERVNAGTPAIVGSFPTNLSANRLGLSRWLFQPENPLTARVTVNRYWQMLFGQGLVSTPQDFGVQGQRPSHPELLDWLAVRFRESGWDLRALLKLMVTSATYQQSSVVVESAAKIDPDNRLLWRSSTYRWPAEFLRDNALATSGTLVQQVGGPSVKPYQPEGLWIEKNNFSAKLRTYKTDSGDSLYRRSLYTFIRRTSPPPAMITLDAPNRSVCTIKRIVTNTPLQALVMMNDPQFVESARLLAERIQHQANQSLNSRLTTAFRLLTCRFPTLTEVTLLKSCYQQNYQRFEKDVALAKALLSVGEKPMDESLKLTETAALTIVVNLVMNYDGFYMKR